VTPAAGRPGAPQGGAAAGPGRPAARAPLLFGWVRGYPRAHVAGDLLAGCVLAGLLVPQGLGYAGIAGVDLQKGLYAAAAGLLVYAALGTSRHLVVSPTSSSAAMLAAAVAPLAAGDPARYGAFAAALAIGTGLILLLGGVLRLGFASDFIAKPVLKGFTFGLAIRIIVKQAPALLGIDGAKGGTVAQAGHVVQSLGEAHGTTVALGLGALALMVLLPRLVKAVPPGLVALVLGIAFASALGLGDRGVALVGSVPTGLPTPAVPGIGLDAMDTLWAAGVGIALIVYVEALGAGRTLAAKHRYDIVPNREFFALGAANIVSGLFRGICVGGGLSASAANDAAGARSPASMLTACAVIVLTLVLLMPLFALLPAAILAAIVIDAVRRLIDVKELARYVRLKSGVLAHLTAAVGVVLLGVLPGMLIAVILSLILLLRLLSRPTVSELGRVGTSHVFAPLGGEDVVAIPGLSILRPEGPLFFANVDRIRGRVREELAEAVPPKQVLLNLSSSATLGVGGHDLIAQLHDDLKRAGVELALTRVTPEVEEFLKRDGLFGRIGAERIFRSQNDAVDDYVRRHGAPARA
jgi:high affinity sulfate transporter 1